MKRARAVCLILMMTSVADAQPSSVSEPDPSGPVPSEASTCPKTLPAEPPAAACTPPPASDTEPEPTPTPTSGGTPTAPAPQPVGPAAPAPIQVYIQVQPSAAAAGAPQTPASPPTVRGVVFPNEAQPLPPHWLPPPAPDGAAGARPPTEEDSREHRGLFRRMAVGLGYGWVGRGGLGPEPGFKPIDDLRFEGPVLGVSLQGGAGLGSFALAGEISYERMLESLEGPSPVSFQLFGLGLGGTYYLDNDWHLGAQLRLVGLLLWRSSIPCFWDRGDMTWGPGMGATFGKEWFGGDRTGLGLSLQANYAHLQGNPNLQYASVLGQLTLTWF